MKVFYDEGELRISFGVAGEFKLGEPRDIPDETAEILIKKGRLKKYDPSTGGSGQAASEGPAAAGKGGSRTAPTGAVSAKKED